MTSNVPADQRWSHDETYRADLARRLAAKNAVRCPHCGFEGTDDEVDEHRATGVHNDEEQGGSNSPHRPDR